MSKHSIEDSVPVTMPINHADWESDLHILKMREDKQKDAESIYFRLLLKQWYLEVLPANAGELARLLGLRYRTMVTWLGKYAHLFRCDECNGIMWDVKWNHKLTYHMARSRYAGGTQLERIRYCPGMCVAPDWFCDCTQVARSMYNLKTRSYRKDVTCGFKLGTTEYNLTKPNPTKSVVESGVEEDQRKEQEPPASIPQNSPVVAPETGREMSANET